MKATELLPLLLSVQVPLYIAELQKKGGPDAADLALTREAERALAIKGDRLLYPCGRPGETADVVTALAFGIAVLSFLLGGVTVFGKHWESTPSRWEGLTASCAYTGLLYSADEFFVLDMKQFGGLGRALLKSDRWIWVVPHGDQWAEVEYSKNEERARSNEKDNPPGG